MRATAVGAVALGGAIAGNVSGEGAGEVAKFDFAGDGGVRRDLHEAVVDLRLRAQDVIQAAHGGGAALENVGDPAEGDHGPDQKAEIAVERDQGTEGDLAAKKLMAALPEDDEEGSADERLKRRHEHAPSADELDVAGDVFAIGLVEAADFGFFLGVSADDADAGKIFLDLCGKSGESGLNGFVEIVDNFAEVAHGDGYDGHGQKHPKRERRRKARHDDDRKDHGHERLAGVHDAGAEDHADVVKVVGGAGHQFAGAIADVELRLHEEKAIEQACAEIEFDVAGDADEHPARGEGQGAFEQDADNKDEAVDAQSVAAVRGIEGNVAAEPVARKRFCVRVALERAIAAGENVGHDAGGEWDDVADDAGQRESEQAERGSRAVAGEIGH